jgi:peptide/nickel transport system ATP-binding protein
VVLEVKSLAKSFWLKQGLFGKREFKAVQGELPAAPRPHAGRGGRIGFGQDDHGPDAAAPARAHGGEVLFDGRNLLTLSDRRAPAMRRRIQIVFQNPYASLNPRFTIGQTLIEPMAIHGIGADTAEREARARALLDKVGWTPAPSASTRTSSPAASASASPSPAA